MSVLLDSSVVIDVPRGMPEALRFTAAQPEVPFCSEITRVEVLRGVRGSERSRTGRYLRALRRISVDESIGRRATELGRRWRKGNAGVSTPDLIVGASALELGIPLATGNVERFPMFPGLKPPYTASACR